MTDDNVIEEAAKAMFYENMPATMNRDQWDSLWPEGDTRTAYVDMARAVFAVFEKAHAPTGDAAEREEISRIIDGHIDVPVSSRLAIARSLQGNGFRRSEVPEPQGEPSCCDAPGGPERCGDCPLDRKPAQGEPSDAQVRVAWRAFDECEHEGSHAAMRAALRAAGGVR